MNLENALASGIPIGVGQRGRCDLCNAELRPNDHVEVLVLIDGADVSVVTTRCASCSRGQIRPETSRPCWLARGRLAASIDANDRSQLILSGAEVIDRTE